MKEGIIMTKEKALQVSRLLEEIETIDMLNEELANLLASEQFDMLPAGLRTELFQIVEQYLNEKQDELDEL
jgi:glutathionyl-hydroquinone reductase